MQTMRNWLIGYYIVEFEQHGKDRAEYGTQLLKKLEERVNRKGLTRNTFQSSRNFYRIYPQMIENFKNRMRLTQKGWSHKFSEKFSKIILQRC